MLLQNEQGSLSAESGWHLLETKKGRKVIPSLLYYVPVHPIVTKYIAAFDFVNTLIWSNRGDYTVRGTNEWVWRSEAIPKFLADLSCLEPEKIEPPWTVVIFSNYISKNLQELRDRVDKVREEIEVYCREASIFFFASLANDEYKKPAIGMWTAFVSIWEQLAGKRFVLDPNSFYIGDRAGDPNALDPMYRKGGVIVNPDELIDLNLPIDTPMGEDSLFAARIGLNFLLPDELPSQPSPDFPPEEEGPEMIIMVGQPGSGKTTWAKK